MKIVIFGGGGGLGQKVVDDLAYDPSHSVYSPRSNDVDIRQAEVVETFFRRIDGADVVINLAVRNHAEMLHKAKRVTAKEQVEVNALGFLNILRGCLPHMREQKFGRIIYVSSILAERPLAGTALYSATKCFSESLVRSTALENANKGITCNTLQLGYFAAGIIQQVPDKLLADILDRTPAQRLGAHDDLHMAIRFLMTNDFVTGATLQVNGGLHLA